MHLANYNSYGRHTSWCRGSTNIEPMRVGFEAIKSREVDCTLLHVGVLWSTLVNFGLLRKKLSVTQPDTSALSIFSVRRVLCPLFAPSRAESCSRAVRGRPSSWSRYSMTTRRRPPSSTDSEHAKCGGMGQRIRCSFSSHLWGQRGKHFADFLGNRHAISHEILRTRSAHDLHLKFPIWGQPQEGLNYEGSNFLGPQFFRLPEMLRPSSPVGC
jgi:hypothetical protein